MPGDEGTGLNFRDKHPCAIHAKVPMDGRDDIRRFDGRGCNYNIGRVILHPEHVTRVTKIPRRRSSKAKVPCCRSCFNMSADIIARRLM